MKRTILLLLAFLLAFSASAGTFRTASTPAAGVGHYRVTLSETVLDRLEDVATELARTYGGRLEVFAEEGFRGFMIAMLPQRAELLSRDSRVVLVEEVVSSAQAAPALIPSRPPLPAGPAPVQPTSMPQPAPVLHQGDSARPGDSGTITYDGAGNMKTAGDDEYQYDTAGRLLRGSAYQHAAWQEYTYDAYGNRRDVKTFPSDYTCRYGVDCGVSVDVDPSTNRLRASTSGTVSLVPTYDEAGNLTSVNLVHQYTYDAVGMVTSQSVPGHVLTYVYTVDDERIGVLDGSTWTWSIRDLKGRILREFTSSATWGNWQWKGDYLYRGDALLAAETAGGVHHYHLDHLGTPRVVTDDAGLMIGAHAYLPFGAELELFPREAPEEKRKFTGHERDDIGADVLTLDYMHARYYSGAMGHFLSVDPKPNVRRAVTHPQAWNRYSYAVNNPPGMVDPDGREALDPTVRAFLEHFYEANFSKVQVHGGLIARILATTNIAITFGNHVFFSRTGWNAYKSIHQPGASSLRVENGIAWTGHEVTHTLQARPMGTASWVLSYLREWAAVGFNYWKIPYEIEADANEKAIRELLQTDPDLQQSIEDGSYGQSDDQSRTTTWTREPVGTTLLQRYYIRPLDYNDPFRGTGFCDAGNTCH